MQRVFLFFNIFTTHRGDVGYGHARVTLKPNTLLTQDVVKEAEASIKSANPDYRAITITNIVQIDA